MSRRGFLAAMLGLSGATLAVTGLPGRYSAYAAGRQQGWILAEIHYSGVTSQVWTAEQLALIGKWERELMKRPRP